MVRVLHAYADEGLYVEPCGRPKSALVPSRVNRSQHVVIRGAGTTAPFGLAGQAKAFWGKHQQKIARCIKKTVK